MSKHFEVIFSSAATKAYEAIRDKKLLKGINRTIDDIAENPYQFPKLSGVLEGFRKAKTFSYRVIFRIHEKEIQILIFAIGPRADVYR